MNDRDLAALGLAVARVIELRGGIEAAGIMRQMAKRLVQISDDACERCGSPIERKPNGRPAKFCSSRCRLAAHRETKAIA